jgi:hypothetical protein
MVYSLLIELPFSPQLRRMNGVHLVKDGGLSNDTYEVELDKLVVDSWTYTENFPHKCVGNGDCLRCSNNIDMEVEHLEISPIHSKTKLVYERRSGMTLGSIFSNWAQID